MGQCYEGDGCEEAITAARKAAAGNTEDYAVRAAREWFTENSQYALNLQEESIAIERLVTIIRKHTEAEIEADNAWWREYVYGEPST